MHIEVLYANVGSLGNPQAKIIGVKRIFQQSDISFQVSASKNVENVMKFD